MIIGMTGIILAEDGAEKYELYFWSTNYEQILECEQDAEGFAIINRTDEGDTIVQIHIEGLKPNTLYEFKSSTKVRDSAMTNVKGIVNFHYNYMDEKFTSVNIWNTERNMNIMGFAYGDLEY